MCSSDLTQTLAKEGGMAGLPEGHLWIAETQSRGRGRLERLWESAYGGLWFSLLLRPPVPPSRIPPLTLLAGLCLRNAIAKICGVDAKLKWPNDLIVPSPQPRQDYRRVAGSLATSPDMHGGRGRGRAAGEGSFKKLAGILTEMSGQMDRTDWVVIGVGLNVNNTISKGLAELAT